MLVATAISTMIFITLATLYGLCASARPSRSSARSLFRPFHFFLVQFLAYFIMPMWVVLGLSAQIPGLPYMSVVYANFRVVKVLTVLAVFYVVVVTTYMIVRARAHKNANILRPSRSDINVALALFLVGTTASVLLDSIFSSGPRSDLVKSTTGQILYGITFMNTAGFIVYALHNALERRYIRLLVIIIMFAAPLFLLGGRGRVLWPVVVLAFLYMAVSGRIFPLYKIAGLVICVFVALLSMDPLLSVIHGDKATSEFVLGSPNASSLLYDIYLEKRNFDGFYNAAVIVYYDDVPYSIMYLLTGVREIFMGTYFPDVLRKGFGYPATLPGTFWLVGGFVGVLAGAVVYGVILAAFDFIYFQVRTSATMALVLYLSTIIANPSSAVTDNLGKIMACVFAFCPYYFARAVTGRRGGDGGRRPEARYVNERMMREVPTPGEALE